MHVRTTTYLAELARRSIPTSLTGQGDVRAGMAIPDLPFVQLHEPLDEARLAELTSRPAIERLALAGGSSVPLRELAALRGLRALSVSSMFDAPHPGYADLEHLPALEALSIASRPLTVDDLGAVARSRVAVLELTEASATAEARAALEALAQAPALEVLQLSSNKGRVEPEWLLPLASCPALRVLDLRRCGWLREGHLELLPRLPLLDTLAMGNGSPQDVVAPDAAVAAILRRCEPLRTLDLVDFRDAVAKTFKTISGMPLRRLDVGTTWTEDRKMTDKVIAHLAALKGLEHIGLHACARLTDTGFAPLTALEALDSFTMTAQHSVATATIERFLEGLPALRALSVHADLGDATVAALAGRLRTLRLGDSSKLGPASYRAIAAMSDVALVELWNCHAGPEELDLLAACPHAASIRLFFNEKLAPDVRAAYPTLHIH